jgi:hypothetical protein
LFQDLLVFPNKMASDVVPIGLTSSLNSNHQATCL